MRLIVLGAQPFRNELLNVKDLESPLLIPDMGKPIFHQMKTSQIGVKTSFVINETSHLTDLLLQRFAESNPEIEVVKIRLENLRNHGPADTLKRALQINPIEHEPLIIAFGDNLFDLEEVFLSINKNSDYSSKVIAFTTHFLDAQRYTYFLVDEKDRVTDYLPKNFRARVSPNIRTDVGVYYFSDARKLFINLIDSECETMRDILINYDVVNTHHLDSWRDFGHWDLLTNARHIGQSRNFNSLEFVSELGCLKKKSSNVEKIGNEILFFENLPKEFELDFPRLHETNSLEGYYSIEYWPLKSLSEYIVYWRLNGSKLIDASSQISSRLEKYSKQRELVFELDQEQLYDFYASKFMKVAAAGDPSHASLLSQHTIQLNGNELRGFPLIIPSLLNRLRDLCANPVYGFLHGDLCFSNILYSPEEGLMKFIDPRGSFMNLVNYGDLRYDLAKLFQGLGGFYDFIKAGFYSVSQNQDLSWDLKLFVASTFVETIPSLEDLLLKHFPDVQKADIYFFVALNFISLLPMHSDNENDQIVFILVSLLILNSGDAYSLVEDYE